MSEHEYLTRSGARADKRRWTIGTRIAVQLPDHEVITTRTTSIPRQFGCGAWGVRVNGIAWSVALSACVALEERAPLAVAPEGISKSDSDKPHV